jgi:hypothetical protein
MDNNTITLTTKIPIKNIINNVIKKEPKNVCEFDNLLLLEFSKIFFDNLENEQKLILNKGGSKIKTKTKTNKTNKSKKVKTNKSKKVKTNKSKKVKTNKNKIRKIQKGGADPRIIIFFIFLFFVFSKGIKNMTDIDVIKRIKEANNVSILFKNDYGTCALNSLLFLKSIDLPTFEQLSIGIIKNQIKLNRFNIGSYLNKELHIYSKWFKITEKTEEKNLRIGIELSVQNYIEKIKNRLIDLRKFYNFSENQSIITEMNYPFKNTLTISHSVVIWLTSENELVIIDPQKFIKNELELFTNNPLQIMFNDKMLKTKSMNDYIKQNIDLYNSTFIFESIHIELEDLKGENILDQENINLQQTLSRIQQAKEQIENRSLSKIEEL